MKVEEYVEHKDSDFISSLMMSSLIVIGIITLVYKALVYFIV